MTKISIAALGKFLKAVEIKGESQVLQAIAGAPAGNLSKSREMIVKEVCKYCKVKESEFYSKTKTKNNDKLRATLIVIYCFTDLLKIDSNTTAHYLIKTPTLIRIYKRKIAALDPKNKTDKSLLNDFKTFKNQITIK